MPLYDVTSTADIDNISSQIRVPLEKGFPVCPDCLLCGCGFFWGAGDWKILLTFTKLSSKK